MKKVSLNLKENSYEIIIGKSILLRLAKFIKSKQIGTYAYVISNKHVVAKCGKILNKALDKSRIKYKYKLVPDSEKAKSVTYLTEVIKDIAKCDKNKDIFVIALGGGVVGDLSGFVASVYKRGVPYIQVPTTLLAQVDSAIGGKTAVDLELGKNLVGAFYQPRAVFSELNFLKSLSKKQLSIGLSEIIKYALIKDKDLFSYLENNRSKILGFNLNCLEYLVYHSSYIKAKVVEKDEKEKKGIRTILNFGHTFGHAIEAAGKFGSYSHGEAVVLGMLIACDVSSKLKLIDKKVCLRIEALIKSFGLPVCLKKLPLAKIMDAFMHDKKFRGAKNRLVLITSIGSVVVKENIEVRILEEAIRNRMAI